MKTGDTVYRILGEEAVLVKIKGPGLVANQWRVTGDDEVRESDLYISRPEAEMVLKTERAIEHNETEAANALLCPLMSGMELQPAKSEACIKERCALYVKVDNACAVTSIATSLLESKMGT